MPGVLFFNATLLFYHVHHLQGHTAQTLMGPLGSCSLVFPMGQMHSDQISFGPLPPTKIHHRVNIDAIPINAKKHCVWQTCDGLNRVSSHCIPPENGVKAQHDVQANAQANPHIEGIEKMLFCHNANSGISMGVGFSYFFSFTLVGAGASLLAWNLHLWNLGWLTQSVLG